MNNRSRSGRPSLVLLSLALWLGLAPVTPVTAQQSLNDYYEDAQRYSNQGEPEAALIQLMNALSQDDQHVPSLILAGDIYLQLGDAPTAEFSYGEALLLGADANYITPRIAEAYLAQNKYRQVIDELSPDQLNGSGKADLLGYRAIAQLKIDAHAASEASIRQALSINPDSRVANIASAQVLLAKGLPEAAQGVTAKLIELYPLDAQSWRMRATTLHEQGLEQDALAAYSRAVEYNPYLINARLALAALLIATDQVEAATTEVDFVQVQRPSDPRGAYLKAVLLELNYENTLAVEQYRRCAELLSLADTDLVAEDVQLTIMAANSHIKQGEAERARSYLEAYYSRDKSNLEVGRFLAGLLLIDGDFLAASSVLDLLLTAAPDDPELLTLKAQAQKNLGQHEQAVATWRVLIRNGHGSTEVDAQIAMSQIMAGDLEAGIEGLEIVLRSDNTRVQETFLLAKTYLQRGNYDRAVSLSKQLIQLQPDNPEYWHLLGRSHMFSGDLETAYQVLDTAAVAHPIFLPVLISLAEVETLQGNLAVARDRLRALSAVYPDSGEVMLQLARVERLSGDLQQARKLAENAASSNPRWIEPRKILVRILLDMGKKAEAVQMARQTSARNPDNMEAKFLLAQVQVAVGKSAEARATYQLVARRAPLDHELLYRIALEQAKLGALSDASDALSRATSVEPGSFKYRVAYIQVLLKLENYQAALGLASESAEDFPNNAILYGLRGQAYAGLGKVQETKQQFAIAMWADPDNRKLVLDEYRALSALGEIKEAERALTAWLEKKPEDKLVNYAYSELLINTQRWPQAETLLSEMLEREPGNPLLLNNLAFVLQEMGRPEALEIARQAQAIAPHLPQINDTLGWILVRNAQAQEGLAYLREAVARRSEDPAARYHLAVALHQLGRQSEAARELRMALLQAEDFEGRREAEALLATIK